MKKSNKPQTDYTAMTNGFQLVMELDCEIKIEKNAPVRLLNAVMERMDYSKLYAAYSRLGRIEYSPKILLKIMVYGYMRKQISSRALEACCRENIHFMYLLEGQPAPDHNTINRFRKNIMTEEAGQDILRQLVLLLHQSGLLSFEAAFIDGTKIEANANKYSFVWKKATVKKTEKLYKTIHVELPTKLKECGIRFYIPEKIRIRQLKKLRKRIHERIKDEMNVPDALSKKSVFVHAAAKSLWKNATKSSMYPNVLPDNVKRWKQKYPRSEDDCFG